MCGVLQNSASEGKLGKWQVSVNRDKEEIVLKAERELTVKAMELKPTAECHLKKCK